MVNIVHRIGFKTQAEKVYKAISTIEGLSNWWTNDVAGEEKVDGKINFTFRTSAGEVLGTMMMQIKNLTASSEVRWLCIEGPEEWIGTEVTFELSQQGEQTILIFGHRNWREEVEFTAHCSMKWAIFMLSLKQLVETGKGKPSPDDIKIDNWN